MQTGCLPATIPISPRPLLLRRQPLPQQAREQHRPASLTAPTPAAVRYRSVSPFNAALTAAVAFERRELALSLRSANSYLVRSLIARKSCSTLPDQFS